jgi:hypothetical protein
MRLALPESRAADREALTVGTRPRDAAGRADVILPANERGTAISVRGANGPSMD